jgi:hypothetical protein
MNAAFNASLRGAGHTITTNLWCVSGPVNVITFVARSGTPCLRINAICVPIAIAFAA